MAVFWFLQEMHEGFGGNLGPNFESQETLFLDLESNLLPT